MENEFDEQVKRVGGIVIVTLMTLALASVYPVAYRQGERDAREAFNKEISDSMNKYPMSIKRKDQRDLVFQVRRVEP